MLQDCSFSSMMVMLARAVHLSSAGFDGILYACKLSPERYTSYACVQSSGVVPEIRDISGVAFHEKSRCSNDFAKSLWELQRIFESTSAQRSKTHPKCMPWRAARLQLV